MEPPSRSSSYAFLPEAHATTRPASPPLEPRRNAERTTATQQRCSKRRQLISEEEAAQEGRREAGQEFLQRQCDHDQRCDHDQQHQ